MNHPPRLWYSRGYLPHFDSPAAIQALTFRLGDSVPEKLIAEWRVELGMADAKAEAELRRRIARWEDAGHGSCLLGNPRHAALVEGALLHFDGDRYRLLEWCVMPNHVHIVLAQTETETLDRIVKSWKSYTAKEINKAEGRTGAFWARDYYDRYIRDEDHLRDARRYTRENPVKARLCASPDEWRFGSAWAGRQRTGGAGLRTDQPGQPVCDRQPGSAGLQTGAWEGSGKE